MLGWLIRDFQGWTILQEGKIGEMEWKYEFKEEKKH